MLKTITTALLLAAATTGAAHAGEIRVSLAGKDASTIRAEIRAAAAELCRSNDVGVASPLDLNPELTCRRQAIRSAEASWKAIELAKGGAAQLASR